MYLIEEVKLLEFSWQCPFCGRFATIRDADISEGSIVCYQNTAEGKKILLVAFITCPNKKCKRYTLKAILGDAQVNTTSEKWEMAQNNNTIVWNLIPESQAQIFPEYIPKAILGDYNEACKIVNLSPKASATLSRRCLQGMIRDFWNIKKPRLVDEIEEIRGKVDSETWAAIDAVRSIGNIGAHMEKDIDLIIDVDPKEATLLISLIETLIKEWYILRYERQVRMRQIVETSNSKDAQKNGCTK